MNISIWLLINYSLIIKSYRSILILKFFSFIIIISYTSIFLLIFLSFIIIMDISILLLLIFFYFIIIRYTPLLLLIFKKYKSILLLIWKKLALNHNYNCNLQFLANIESWNICQSFKKKSCIIFFCSYSISMSWNIR